jgi:hypothetical protein
VATQKRWSLTCRQPLPHYLQGRVRTYCLVADRLRAAEDWLAAQRIEWEARADRFQQYVEHLEQREAP